MDTSAPSGSGAEVILNSAPKKRISAARYWCFTLNNYTEEEWLHIIKLCERHKYIVGKEVGEKGTPHLQGYVAFEKKCRPMETFDNKRIHWEKTKANEQKNYDYCSKEGNFKTNINVLKLCEPTKEWQQGIIKLIETEPDDRTINWYFDPVGGTGKTQLSKYLAHHYGAIPLNGKANDILYAAATFDSRIYIFDIPRTQEDYLSYQAIECIKNGFFLCAKYESKPIIRNPPHILVFANFLPDTSKLSSDRWNIVYI